MSLVKHWALKGFGVILGSCQPPSRLSLDKPREFKASKHQATMKSPDKIRQIKQHVRDLARQGKIKEAEIVCKDLIESGAGDIDVYQNLAAIYAATDRAGELLEVLQVVVQLNPENPSFHNNLGTAYQQNRLVDLAIASYKKALSLKPHYPIAQQNLGTALYEKGDLDSAIASYIAAIKLQSDLPDAYNYLGVALSEKGEAEAAISSLKMSLQLKPENSEAYNNLGSCLVDQCYLDEAITSFNNAIRINSNYPEANWNLSLINLLSGNYKEGWVGYEWRARKRDQEFEHPHASPNCNRLRNYPPLGISVCLLVVTEQGLGDTLQFMRYIKALREKKVQVFFCAQEKLHDLIKASGIDQNPLTPHQANNVSDGYWIPLLSVPKHLDVSPQNPIITEPYIKTTEELTAKWKEILSTEKRPIIGVNWQGNPLHEAKHSKGRSLPLSSLEPLAQKTNASLLSLQKGFGSEQLETCSFKECFVSCQDRITDTWNFLETAAIIANCDLVITSDTSVAHLAGGMGKKTWLLLKKIPDWRWGLEGDTTFWYPSMRLFRQKERGNWSEVMERITTALQDEFPGISAADFLTS